MKIKPGVKFENMKFSFKVHRCKNGQFVKEKNKKNIANNIYTVCLKDDEC